MTRMSSCRLRSPGHMQGIAAPGMLAAFPRGTGHSSCSNGNSPYLTSKRPHHSAAGLDPPLFTHAPLRSQEARSVDKRGFWLAALGSHNSPLVGYLARYGAAHIRKQE